MNDDVELVAMAFYALQDNARGWDREPERLKEAFRQDARTAIATVDAAVEARYQATNLPFTTSGMRSDSGFDD